MKRLDDYKKPSGVFSAADGWHEATVELPAPQDGVEFNSEEDAPHFPVEGVHFRDLLELIIAEVQDPRLAEQRHWYLHERYWHPPQPQRDTGSPSDTSQTTPSSPPDPIRIITKTYNSNDMLCAHEELRQMPRCPDDLADLEYAILLLLAYSDSTHLASFGSASLWPIYIYIGNVTKYIRGRPMSFTAQHLTYLPKLPDNVQDFYEREHGAHASAETLRWLRCELMQKIWELILNDKFKDAYRHGVVVECADGVIRRLFPRLFVYSADYPEKVLIAAMRHLGECPCPRCLIKMKQINAAGTTVDTQRRAHKRVDTEALQYTINRVRASIFKNGLPMASKRAKDPLKNLSLFPIQSTLSKFMFEFKANFYELFAPDLMHEFELGVWKGVFNHLLRLLVAQGGGALQTFNERSVFLTLV
ncbi:hypothetical protein L226DRAFT_473339 [Lentinus tigrinus ALCF2SS1-7]|uniref:Uncharacterized protein n=1 Tax=Lentinus tigrinus ALCF2SS1-6 TaxID=1328759 RepID=A0A5C2RNY2_9APHY|nr:hypothetical protein L227DRAFT_513433 [Lentinus tigrinus ALCF2SS1-6]RPD68462.1 hypothetical protein L226DRAFT_473339 [Lentinus tigrinus ALCF2SS1-7]